MNNIVYEFIHTSLSYEDEDINIVDTQLFYTLEDAMEYLNIKQTLVYDEYVEHIQNIYENDELDIQDLISDPEFYEYTSKDCIGDPDRQCKKLFSCNYTDYGSDELIIYKKRIMKFA